MFNLGKVVVGLLMSSVGSFKNIWIFIGSYIFVESHFSHLDQRKFAVWPDLRDIKKGPTDTLSLLGLHNLKIELPDWIVFPGNRVPDVLIVVIGADTSRFSSFRGRGEVGRCVFGAEMPFAIAEITIIVDQLERVNTKTCDPANRVRQTSATEQVHQGVYTLWLVDVKVPELGRVSIYLITMTGFSF